MIHNHVTSEHRSGSPQMNSEGERETKKPMLVNANTIQFPMLHSEYKIIFSFLCIYLVQL